MNRQEAMVKKKRLRDLIGKLDSLLVAFSGGVDSTYLLAEAWEVLGKKVVAVTATSPIHPDRELQEAVQFARDIGVDHIVFSSEEMDSQVFLANAGDRCYHCKKGLSEKLLAIATKREIIHVAHGANMDDLGDYRPGFKAAQEAGMIAPLMEAELGKDEIRFLAKEMGLELWNKPAMACLASRIPYGNPITVQTLQMVDQAEDFLRDAGFDEVRVRHHGSVARIEVAPHRIKEMHEDPVRSALIRTFREIGFEHVAIDLEGYKQGKMNRELTETLPDSGSD